MRASKDFIAREIAGEYILVPVGAAAAQFNGLVTVNELGKFIFDVLAEERTQEAVVEEITAVYDVDRQTAAADLAEFLDKMREIGALVE